ncbi:hypothetical protein D9613_008727 [Agrocybe pediades]|uniref:Uncharacterized protein n=1 Tax=Agrocybe pediades TaxID=84607 RepID=A0A8H4VR29_9AGAR|nr:hypothetical protein D9613_008727 [Agrocybe pediades]
MSSKDLPCIDWSRPQTRMLLYAILCLAVYGSSNAIPLTALTPHNNDIFTTGSNDSDSVCPRTRLEIIWSCLATILAASWVSVHPNMPGPNESKVKKTLRRIDIMFWAIITLELIIYWTMRQRYGARQMEKEFVAVYRKKNDRFHWTKTHGFFLQMGVDNDGDAIPSEGDLSTADCEPTLVIVLLEEGTTAVVLKVSTLSELVDVAGRDWQEPRLIRYLNLRLVGVDSTAEDIEGTGRSGPNSSAWQLFCVIETWKTLDHRDATLISLKGKMGEWRRYMGTMVPIQRRQYAVSQQRADNPHEVRETRTQKVHKGFRKVCPNASKVKKTLRRSEIMLWAIITPELIIMWAMAQWFAAKKMEKEFISKYRKPNDGFKWTKKHGFFLQMGGFVLYEKDKPKRILEWKALMEYYEKGRVDLSEITEAAVDDRSKADAFGKCIAFIQTSWFIIQCIARFSDNRLVLTELELITAALAVLSLPMYCFWWNKPFNAEVPITIVLLDPIHEIRSHQDSSIQDLSMQPDGYDVLPIYTKAISKFRAFILARIEFVRNNLLTWDSLQKIALIPFNVFEYVRHHLSELGFYTPDYPYAMKVPMFYYSKRLLSEDVFYHIQLGSFLVAALFGAIHCAGWSDKMIFHTRAVSFLWRISSVIITGFPLLWILIVTWARVKDAVDGSEVLAKASEALTRVILLLYVSSVPLYIAARIILLILAFTELRYIPQGALNNIPWANALPFIH